MKICYIEINKNLCVLTLTLTFIFLFYVGCAPSWIPTDKSAVELVRDYYLFFAEGETVQATVAKRGEYIKDCSCYPIQFKITSSSARTNFKTFFFYKNTAGDIAVKEFVELNSFNAN